MMKRELLTLASVCVLLALLNPAQALTEAEKQRILDDHNYYRANIAMYGPPPATPLPALIWEDDLATVASQWTYWCSYETNPERSSDYASVKGTKPYIEYVGENMAHTTACDYFNNSAVENCETMANATDRMWYALKDDWYYEPNRLGDRVWGQIVSESTTRIGCSSNMCSAPNNFWRILVYCNYATGASPDRPPYVTGSNSPGAPSPLGGSPGAQSPNGGSPMAQSPIGGSPNNSTVMAGAAAARTPHPFLILVFIASTLFLIGGI